MVTNKQEAMAAERGCPEPMYGFIDVYWSFDTDTHINSCSLATETHFPVGSKPLWSCPLRIRMWCWKHMCCKSSSSVHLSGIFNLWYHDFQWIIDTVTVQRNRNNRVMCRVAPPHWLCFISAWALLWQFYCGKKMFSLRDVPAWWQQGMGCGGSINAGQSTQSPENDCIVWKQVCYSMSQENSREFFSQYTREKLQFPALSILAFSHWQPQLSYVSFLVNEKCLGNLCGSDAAPIYTWVI